MNNKKPNSFLLTAGILLATSVISSQDASAAAKPTYDSKMMLGQSLQFNGNMEQAIKAYKYAAALKPKAFDPHFALVNLYVQQQDFKAAAEECREALKLKPGNHDLHLLLGNLTRAMSGATTDAAEAKQLVEEAIKELELAEKTGANSAQVHSTLAVVHVQNGDFDKALEHVDIALDKNDKQPDSHLIRGVLKFKKGDKDTALKELDIAIKQKGKNAEARNTKADILASIGKTDDAIAEYKRALEDEPRYAQALSGIANILIQNQKWEDALSHLQKAAELRTGDANTLYSIGICLEKLGKVDLAVPKFNEGIMVDPNPATKEQIRAHVLDLQKNSLLNVPGLMSPGGIGPAAPGAGVFGPGSSIFTESFKDMIKIKTPGEKEDKKQKQEKKGG